MELHRIGKFSLEEVFLFLRNRDRHFKGFFVNKKLKKYKMFKNNLTCTSCGLTGSFFALEEVGQFSEKYTFNLYAINKTGVEVLINRDHIIPRSRGGSNSLRNLQTMCFKCNNAKGNRLIENDLILKI